MNPLPENAHQRLGHSTFHSESMGVEIGYAVYLPPGYEDPPNAHRRYPVVYYLHGGRLGSEVKDVHMTRHFDKWIRSGDVPPRIYVFVNGGRLSHYDYRQSLAETALSGSLFHTSIGLTARYPIARGERLKDFLWEVEAPLG